MRWLRRRRKEVAEDFVKDATEKLKENVTEKSIDYLSLISSAFQIVIFVAEVATLTGTGSVPAVSSSPTIINNGTIYILGGK